MAYQAVLTLLKFECHYCGESKTVDPNDVEQAATVANMLKVQRADGSAFAYCNHECLRAGARYFGKHPLQAVNEAGNQFAEAEPTGIVLTDGLVEHNDSD